MSKEMQNRFKLVGVILIVVGLSTLTNDIVTIITLMVVGFIVLTFMLEG
jgi:uncharacterized membrane protein HdeD (DUF308 family)